MRTRTKETATKVLGWIIVISIAVVVIGMFIWGEPTPSIKLDPADWGDPRF